ncbi:MAG: histidine phosphatase family protein [Lachnospiraceae bacterium]|nr:histidine phosphatase family protein [Lachnospiraceae bacterium]
MKIILARHGETNWNLTGQLIGQQDIVLNERGIEQAKVLRDKLANVQFDVCYSSPLARAKETAEIVCEGRCQVICDNRLMERFGGIMEGKVINDWNSFDNDATMETGDSLLSRATRFIEDLKKTNYDTVLVVSHNGLIKNLQHVIAGNNGEVDYRIGGLPNCGFEILIIQ